MLFKGIKAKLVDVFARGKLTGNGLTVFWECGDLSTDQMLALTREMRQFESIFLLDGPGNEEYQARIFTMEEELSFAGHPLIGLAAHLHQEYGPQENGIPEEQEWRIRLASRTVRLVSVNKGGHYSAAMDQGPPEFLGTIGPADRKEYLAALNLTEEDAAGLDMEVISTGLPYLIVPVARNLDKARITIPHFEELLARHCAKFVYVLDVETREGRTWDNAGMVEDIATGSAAGPAAAYLHKAGLVPANRPFHLEQGRMTGRPSRMEVVVESDGDAVRNIRVSGDVFVVATIDFA